MFRILLTWQRNEEHNETNQGLIILPSSLSLPSWSPFIRMWHTSSSRSQHLVRLPCILLEHVGLSWSRVKRALFPFCSGMYYSGFQRAGSSITSSTEQKCDGTRWVGVWGDGVGPTAEIKVWEEVIGREGEGGGAGRKDRWKLRKRGTTVGAGGK